MDSDDSNISDHVGDLDIQPYQFEPLCNDESQQEREHSTSEDSDIDHRRMGHGFRFLLPPFLYYPPPLFSKFSYKSFLFQNFHNHSFFLHFTISVDVIHHE